MMQTQMERKAPPTGGANGGLTARLGESRESAVPDVANRPQTTHSSYNERPDSGREQRCRPADQGNMTLVASIPARHPIGLGRRLGVAVELQLQVVRTRLHPHVQLRVQAVVPPQ